MIKKSKSNTLNRELLSEIISRDLQCKFVKVELVECENVEILSSFVNFRKIKTIECNNKETFYSVLYSS